MAKISSRLLGVSESATLKLNATVQEMRAKGVDVINLTAGEPDFFVHEAGKKAVIDAVAANHSKYTPAAGLPELRKLIADKTNRQQPKVSKAKPWTPGNVIVSNGGKQALFNAFLAILDPTGQDEVVIPSPYWLSYPEMVKIAGGVPRLVRAPFEQGFKLKPEQLESALTARTKAVLLNSPSNPTGVMYSQEELTQLGKVLERAAREKCPDLWVISDEIYDRNVFGKTPFCSFLEAAPQLRDRTITVNGMSKSAAMTGWRVGWSVAGPELTQAMLTLQGQSTSGINALAQWASIAVLKVPEDEFRPQVESFRKRRDIALDILKKAGKIQVIEPEGAFYAFVGFGGFLRKGEDSLEFAQRLLEQAKVAVVPGTPFGEPEFVRLSFATDEESLREGCRRIVDYVETA